MRLWAERRAPRHEVLEFCGGQLEDNQNITGPELAQIEEDFKERIKLAKDVFGAKMFRYTDMHGKAQTSQPLYDGVMVALDRQSLDATQRNPGGKSSSHKER